MHANLFLAFLLVAAQLIAPRNSTYPAGTKVYWTLNGSTPGQGSFSFATDSVTDRITIPVFIGSSCWVKSRLEIAGVLGQVESSYVFVREDPLPIVLLYFTGGYIGPLVIRFEWQTLQEFNTYGFHLLREGRIVAFVPGNGTTTEPHTYHVQDTTRIKRTTYRLQEVSLDGMVWTSQPIILTRSGELTR